MSRLRLRIPYIQLTLVLAAGLLLLGEICRQPETYFEVREGWFFTNDLAKAQQEIPFRIVLPSYMPFNRRPTGFSGYTKERWHEASIEDKGFVTVTYLIQPGALAAFEENNVPSELPWLGNPGAGELFVGNTRVVVFPDTYGPDLKPSYKLWWSKDGISFKAFIDSSRDEAIKIVSSMID